MLLGIAFIFLVIVCIGLCYLVYKLVTRLLYLVERLEGYGEAIDEQLDELNRCYVSLSSAANASLSTDDPVVRKLVNDVKKARDVVHKAARTLASIDEPHENTTTNQA